MGIIDMLMGNSALDEQTVASDMLKDSKFAVFSLAQALTETADAELRQVLTNQLFASIRLHHQLSDLVRKKDWYKPFLAPEEQLGADMRLAENVGQKQ